jgi:outer membrane protein TolC
MKLAGVALLGIFMLPVLRGSCLSAEDGAGARLIARFPTTPHDGGAKGAPVIVPVDLDEARWRRDVLMPKLWQRPLGKGAGARVGTIAATAAPAATSAATPSGARDEGQPTPGDADGTLGLTLDDTIEIALRHNLTVQIARLSRDAVEYEIPKAKAIFHPTVGFSAAAAGDREEPEGDPISDTETQDGQAFLSERLPTGASVVVSTDAIRTDDNTAGSPTNYGSGYTVSVVQPLFRGGGFVVATRPIADARYDLRIEEARLRAEILRVTAAAKSAYYSVMLTEEIIGVTEEAIARDQTLVEASREFLNAGIVTKRDLYSAEFLLASDSAKLVGAVADRDSARNTLLDVLGIPIGTEIEILDRDLTFQPLALELDKWIATAIVSRPEVKEVEELLEKNLLDVKVSVNGVLPQLDLLGSYRRDQEATTFSRARDLHGREWTAGVVFSIPIGNVAARADLAQANVQQMRLERALLQAKRQVEIEVREAVIKLERSLNSMSMLSTAIYHLRGKLEVAQGQFALGLATNLDITDAQEDLLDTQTDLLNALTEYQVGLAELEASVAGPL